MRRVGARCETMHSGVEGLCTSRAHRGEGSGEETACCEREGDARREGDAGGGAMGNRGAGGKIKDKPRGINPRGLRKVEPKPRSGKKAARGGTN